jgi:predicted TPR repeat methyltransferase
MPKSNDKTNLNEASEQVSPAYPGNLTIAETLALGLQHHNSGNLLQAESLYQQVLVVDPKQPDGLQLLGVIALQKGENELAVDFLTRSLAVASGFANVHCNLGAALRKVGKTDDALASYLNALAIDSNHVQTLLNLGFLYRDTGNQDAAVESLRKALALDPTNTKAEYLLAALTDEKTEAPPEGFIELIFDEHAVDFEQQMKEGNSCLPQIVRSASVRLIEQHRKDSVPPFSSILDLGCGTGRAGVEFRDITDKLHGVDLSPKMMDQAREKGVYDALFPGDFIGFLEHAEDSYDLVLAVDSFLYMGPLEAVFSGVVSVLREGGAFAFTVETLDTGDFALRDTCRHAHGEGYIRQLAADNHLDVVLCEPVDNLRFGIKGTLFWLKKSG